MSPHGRIAYLDGHRGLAILAVYFFHAYSHWPTTPYGDAWAEFPLFKYGKFGVQLFFLISGFVILMTLEKYTTAREFLFRRWLRLFPAMLICSALIFLTSGYLDERPFGRPDLFSLLPGLTFIEPSWWSFALGRPIVPLEGSFWSLYVEWKFYLFAAVTFYAFGRNGMVGALCGAFLFAVLGRITQLLFGAGVISAIIDQSSVDHFGWFAAGAGFYIYVRGNDPRWFLLALSVAVTNAVLAGNLQPLPTLAGIVVTFFFAGSIALRNLQSLLENRVLNFFGFISYPLYLLHENAMIALAIKFGRDQSTAVAVWIPIVVLAVLAILAYLIARFLEPLVKQNLELALKRLASLTVAARPLEDSRVER